MTEMVPEQVQHFSKDSFHLSQLKISLMFVQIIPNSSRISSKRPPEFQFNSLAGKECMNFSTLAGTDRVDFISTR